MASIEGRILSSRKQIGANFHTTFQFQVETEAPRDLAPAGDGTNLMNDMFKLGNDELWELGPA